MNQPLDFFVMTSSVITLSNLAGEASYSAANTFLESFCQYRRYLGLPASVLGVCPLDDVGLVAETPAMRKKLKSQGLFFLPEKEFIDYVELAILHSRPRENDEMMSPKGLSWRSPGHIIMGLRSKMHLDDPNCQASWRRDRRMGMYHNIQDTATGDSSSKFNTLSAFLLRATDEPDILTDPSTAEYLACNIREKICNFMMKDGEEVSTSTTLLDIGVDSLMVIELRTWWKQAFGLDISVLEFMGAGTLAQLGKIAAEGLKKRLCQLA